MSAWRDEKSLRQWVGLNVGSWVVMIVLGFDLYQAALLIALGGLVVIVELINSAIEATVDYVSTDRHPLAKRAKDVPQQVRKLCDRTTRLQRSKK